MVPDHKMVQPRRRVLYIILLLCFGVNILASDRVTQYSGVHIQSSDKGQLALFLVNVVLTKVGKKLDKGYKCPVYCGVTHKHIYWNRDEIEQDNLQTAPELYRTDRIASIK